MYKPPDNPAVCFLVSRIRQIVITMYRKNLPHKKSFLSYAVKTLWIYITQPKMKPPLNWAYINRIQAFPPPKGHILTQ